MATTAYFGSLYDLEHLKSLDLPLYFYFNSWNAKWRAECKAGPQLTGEHISAVQERTTLGKPPSPKLLSKDNSEQQGSRLGQCLTFLLLGHSYNPWKYE